MKRCIAFFAVVAALATSAMAEPVKIRVGHGAAAEEQLWLMKAKPDVTPNQGKAYTLDFQLFRGTDQRFKAVEAKELDVFTSSSSSAIVVYSQGLRFKAVASTSMESTKGFVTQYVVLADSPIKTIADLKGKTIGNNAARSSIELWARMALAKHGVNPERDVSWAIVPFPAQGEALRARKLDVAALPQPFAAAEKAKGGVRTLFTSKEGMPFDEELILLLVTVSPRHGRTPRPPDFGPGGWLPRTGFMSPSLAASEETRAAALDLRARLRREQSTAIVEAIRVWAHQQRALPESSLGKAIAYMLGLWPGPTRFLDDARIPLDNNAAERGLRGMVLGRKNHYGSRSKRGTEVAALFYSLIESAKLCGVEPKAYLLQATRAALENPGTVTLPHALLTA